MRPLDWAVMFGWLVFLVSYGLWRGRGSTSVNQYLLAGKTMPWYAMGLSIMATQASAITFISTTGQAYVDGMRFVQFYFGLPVAMVLLCATAVPIFHRAKVYTAYEYLEQRFDAKTRLIVTITDAVVHPGPARIGQRVTLSTVWPTESKTPIESRTDHRMVTATRVTTARPMASRNDSFITDQGSTLPNTRPSASIKCQWRSMSAGVAWWRRCCAHAASMW